MFDERLFSYPGVKHQAKDVEMGVKMRQRIADQCIARNRHDLIVKIRIEPRKSGVAHPLTAAAELPHLFSGFSESAQLLFRHVESGMAGSIWFEQQAKLVQLVKTLARNLRGSAVANKVRLDHKPFPLQAP